MNDLAALLPLVAILALFWFMVVRPQQRRQQEVVSPAEQHRGRPARDDVLRHLRHRHVHHRRPRPSADRPRHGDRDRPAAIAKVDSPVVDESGDA